jgi:hypothetical protein
MAKTSTSFKLGHKSKGTKAKGVKNGKTVFLEKVGLSSWERLQSFILNEGADKFISNFETLEGKELSTAYLAALEFFKPKLNRVTLEGDENKPIPINFSNLTYEQLLELARSNNSGGEKGTRKA